MLRELKLILSNTIMRIKIAIWAILRQETQKLIDESYLSIMKKTKKTKKELIEALKE